MEVYIIKLLKPFTNHTLKPLLTSRLNRVVIMKYTEYFAPEVEVLGIVVEQGFSISDFEGDLEFPEDGGEI